MRNPQMLSWYRLGLLIRNDIVVNIRVILIAVTAILALLLLHTPSSSFFTLILFIGGLWITSLSFHELNDQQKMHYFLTLPASQLEKVLGRWLVTVILYPVLLTAVFSLFLPLHHMVESLKLYLILQSIFFLGSVYFKTHPIIKTVAFIAIFSLILSLYLLMWIWIFRTGSSFLFYHQLEFFWLVLPIYCWVLSYICFTEKEND